MGRRSDHSREQIRDMAIAAAEQIVVNEGASKLSTRKVARSIGYTAGTLYLVFKNFDDLVLHVNSHTLNDLYAFLQNNADTSQDSTVENIKSLARAYFAFAESEYQRWSLLFEYHAQTEFINPDWFQAQILKNFSLANEQLSKFIPGIQADILQKNTYALWSGVHGICVLHLSGKLSVVHKIDAFKLTDELVTNFLAGLDIKENREGARHVN